MVFQDRWSLTAVVSQDRCHCMDPLFWNFQLYLYSYNEDLDLEDRPPQICPHAIVDFKFVGEYKSSRPPVLKQISKTRYSGTCV